MALRETATGIVQKLQQAGFSAYWVGGCVRDQLLGRDPGDYDIATSARPEQIEALFDRTIPVGRKFGVLLVIEAGHEFQVATFRAEENYQDGRHPSRVTFCDARADAARRDFTVNGLFYDPVAGQLHDWVGGGADLRAGIIRTIGDPGERFGEDHLRLLRAVRFAAQLDFEIEPSTLSAVQSGAPSISTVSCERIRDELIKLLRPPHAARGLRLLHESGLLGHILPEVAATVNCDQSPDFHPEGAVFTHIALMLGLLPADAHPSLPWAVLLHDVAKPTTASTDPETGAIRFHGHERIGAEMAEEILRRLRFPKKQTAEIVACVRWHMQFKDAPNMRKSTLRRMLLRPTFNLELELHRLDCLGSHGMLDIHQFLQEQSRLLASQPEIHPPLLTGDDLMSLGMQPGPALGRMLAELREKQLADELADAEAARQWVRHRLQDGTKL